MAMFPFSRRPSIFAGRRKRQEPQWIFIRSWVISPDFLWSGRKWNRRRCCARRRWFTFSTPFSAASLPATAGGEELPGPSPDSSSAYGRWGYYSCCLRKKPRVPNLDYFCSEAWGRMVQSSMFKACPEPGRRVQCSGTTLNRATRPPRPHRRDRARQCA